MAFPIGAQFPHARVLVDIVASNLNIARQVFRRCVLSENTRILDPNGSLVCVFV